MVKVITVLVVLFFISCEEVKKVEDIKNNKIEKVVVEIKENTNFEKAKTTTAIKSVLPTNVNFGAIYIGIKEENGAISITSNDDNVEPEILRKLNGTIAEVIETDVDGDGFNEFYIVSNSGDLMAFSSYRNVSFGEINVAKKPNSFYENIKELKSWEVKNKKLSLAFEDANGKLNTVRYKLSQGEASYQLNAE